MLAALEQVYFLPSMLPANRPLYAIAFQRDSLLHQDARVRVLPLGLKNAGTSNFIPILSAGALQIGVGAVMVCSR